MLGDISYDSSQECSKDSFNVVLPMLGYVSYDSTQECSKDSSNAAFPKLPDIYQAGE